MKTAKIFLLLLLMPLVGFCQMKPVKLTCVLINDDGSVLLNWYPYYSSPDFARYEVYYSNNLTTPFLKVAEITNLSTVSYLHPIGVSGGQAAHYFVKTAAFSGQEINSDTLSAMLLQASVQQQQRNILSWNAIKTPLPPTASHNYQIFRKYGNLSWDLIDSTPNLTYVDSIYSCSVVNYRIVLMDSACQSSSTTAIVPQDILQPATPRLDSVSVNSLGNVELGWSVSNAPDLAGYYIFNFFNGIWDTLAIINNTSTHFYTDLLANPLTTSAQYAVAAYDHCGNTSGDLGIPQSQKTILLNLPQPDVCLDKIELSWSAYINLPGQVSNYTVFIRENNDNFIPVSIVADTVYNYTHTGLEHNIVYSYYIRANSKNGTHSSSSPIQSLKVIKPGLPDYFYIANATVEKNRSIRLKLFPDSTANISHYELMRAQKAEGPYISIKSFEPPAKQITVYDSSVNVGRFAYYYQFYVYDSCGNLSTFSNLFNTILLKNSESETSMFEWNITKGFDAENGAFEVYRLEGDSLILLAILPPDNLSFTDPDFVPANFEETRYYQVAGVENPGNKYGFKEKTWSNILAFEPEFQFYLPNAFTPTHESNKIFKPIALAYTEKDYYMAIFNRFGQRIFETTDFHEGWNGKHNGRLVNSGPYAYYIRVLSKSGKYHIKTGLIILLD
ncbi:MAG: gliding motility-associated C-terminal domain-containing protein [Bacteroidales bacterium]|nr:gliding motility-associated C-terminal domain-containing protein [Bacteroidales bacterium]